MFKRILKCLLYDLVLGLGLCGIKYVTDVLSTKITASTNSDLLYTRLNNIFSIVVMALFIGLIFYLTCHDQPVNIGEKVVEFTLIGIPCLFMLSLSIVPDLYPNTGIFPYLTKFYNYVSTELYYFVISMGLVIYRMIK